MGIGDCTPGVTPEAIKRPATTWQQHQQFA